MSFHRWSTVRGSRTSLQVPASAVSPTSCRFYVSSLSSSCFWHTMCSCLEFWMPGSQHASSAYEGHSFPRQHLVYQSVHNAINTKHDTWSLSQYLHPCMYGSILPAWVRIHKFKLRMRFRSGKLPAPSTLYSYGSLGGICVWSMGGSLCLHWGCYDAIRVTVILWGL